MKGHPYIGIFNDSFPPIIDGVTLTVQNYIKWLQRAGEEICVCTPWNPEVFEADYKVIKYFSLPIQNRKPYRYGYPKLDPLIWRKMRVTPFKLIHCHCPFSSGRLGVYAARKQHIPLIATFHSKYKADLEHSFRSTPWMVPIIMRRILNFFNACDHVWIPQAAVEETVREYGYRGDVQVMENGNDLASLYASEEVPAVKRRAREKLGIPESRLVLLFVGQHIMEKGLGIIADTLKSLQGKVDYEMHFIGQGYALQWLKDYVRDNGLTERVKVHGQMTDRDLLARHYAAADLFLFPSFYDNAPLVVREAAAMRTPAILLEGSTAAEVIRDGGNGFLTQRSADAYTSLISKLAEHREVISEVGGNARATLTRTWQDVVEEVHDRYAEIIEKYNSTH